MSKYTLSINIRSHSKELLENLVVTLESGNGDIENIESVEILTKCASGLIEYQTPNKLKVTELSHATRLDETRPSNRQLNLFLDKWMLTEPV